MHVWEIEGVSRLVPAVMQDEDALALVYRSVPGMGFQV